MPRELCELLVDGQTFEVPLEVAGHVADLRGALRGSVVVVGEAMHLCNQAVDELEELLDKTILTDARLVRFKSLVQQRASLRAAALHRRAGEG